jgi:intracellular multiplication protein IcmE
LQELMAGMSKQAQSLVTAWQPPTMEHQQGSYEQKTKTVETTTSQTLTNGKLSSTDKSGSSTPSGPPLVKAGTIMFAVLDTAVDSDYPNTPVLATIVGGKLKGAKVLGKLALETGKDKVSLNFNLIDKDDWIATKPVTAFAIDPDTARTVMASSANYHYLLRYGSMFASSFVSGYASAVTSSGGTTTTGIFGTSTQSAVLSPASKIAVGLGQVGTTIGTAMASYFNTPTTVKVNSGVAIGILFMADVPA